MLVAAAEKICCRNERARIRERSLDNTAQIVAAGRRSGGLMLLQKSQPSADNLGFIIETPTGNELIDQPLEMWRYDSAHTAGVFQ
jgi:uncharacterized membrane protein